MYSLWCTIHLSIIESKKAGVTKNKHFLFILLTLSTDFSFEVIASNQCLLNTNGPKSINLFKAQYFSNLSVKPWNTVFTVQSLRTEDLGVNQSKVAPCCGHFETAVCG